MIAIRNLEVAFGTRIVSQVGYLDVSVGEIVGVAGESGSGKTLFGLSLLGLAQHLGATVRGSAQIAGLEIVGMPERQLRELRGRRIAMIMQSPVASLNPTMRLGKLFARTLRLHGTPSEECRPRMLAALEEVLLEEAILERRPYEVSGGQAQRFAIALVTALRSDVVIADEPTSALDVTVQTEVIALLDGMRREHGTTIVLISHDLVLISEVADYVIVMNKGSVVEQGPAMSVLRAPKNPYVRELLAAIPTMKGVSQ
jgi:ABC-type dipeptide/oligopeptide/nickel transport system ATPase component